MSNFQLFIHDDRYSVPVLRMTVVTDEAQMRLIAEGVLAESAHHLGVEVFENGGRLFALGSATDPSPPRPARESPRHVVG